MKARKCAGEQVVVDLIFSVFLLAQVQSLLGEFPLPWFGDSLAVWTTRLLFCQLVPLASR